MAIFGQNRLFFSVEFRQRFIGQPWFPVQLVAGEANRGRFAALRVRGGMPVSGDQRRICADDGLMVERPQAQQQSALEADKGYQLRQVTMPRRLQPALVKVCSAPGVASTGVKVSRRAKASAGTRRSVVGSARPKPA